MPSDPELARDAVSIVIRGQFNPAIISPAWLKSEDLISADDYVATTPELITADVSVLNGPYFDLNVTRETFAIMSTDSSAFETVRDMAVGVLKTLRHTPVSVLGINRMVHFPVDDLDAYHRIGDVLAPKSYWETDLDFAGLQTLTIQGARKDSKASGRVLVTVQPSNLVIPGVFVLHNDHYTLAVDAKTISSREDFRADLSENEATPEKLSIAIEILQGEWQTSMTRSSSVVRNVWAVRNAD